MDMKYFSGTTHTVEYSKDTPSHEFLVTLVSNEDDAYYLVSVVCIDSNGDPLIGKYQAGRYDNRETAIRQAKMLVEMVEWRR
jgi:hypothetical protein